LALADEFLLFKIANLDMNHRFSEQLQDIPTPSAIVDTQRMQRNIDHMQKRMNNLGVQFRPHVKTTKCIEIAKAQIDAGAKGITVSTLKEAEQFFTAGINDILYAVGIVGPKLKQAAALINNGCALKIVCENLQAATDIVAFSQTNKTPFEVWIEVDTDGHRSGVKPDSADLIVLGKALHQGLVTLGGVMTHAGASYELNTPEALTAMAEQERSLCVLAATRLRAAGLPCPNVSVGSTPTALSAQHLDGITEVRAGVYVFFDLVMANVGVCKADDIALSVLATVIGHQSDKGWAIVDAGWMAMSRDRGTQKQQHDFGYGQVCDADGNVMHGYQVTSANQEHGIISFVPDGNSEKAAIDNQFPIGTKLRILPNHACATGAQFPEYQTIVATNKNSSGSKLTTGPTWQRFSGW
jgi:threo-3-hydroxy-D-aspartate ammonia-lyase